ncbi:MAG: hypothetical protein JRN20_01755 [Nitrososphaerota archaeon]|nr:hypothetical protein [Nitrososphaerota archaeon]
MQRSISQDQLESHPQLRKIRSLWANSIPRETSVIRTGKIINLSLDRVSEIAKFVSAGEELQQYGREKYCHENGVGRVSLAYLHHANDPQVEEDQNLGIPDKIMNRFDMAVKQLNSLDDNELLALDAKAAGYENLLNRLVRVCCSDLAIILKKDPSEDSGHTMVVKEAVDRELGLFHATKIRTFVAKQDRYYFYRIQTWSLFVKLVRNVVCESFDHSIDPNRTYDEALRVLKEFQQDGNCCNIHLLKSELSLLVEMTQLHRLRQYFSMLALVERTLTDKDFTKKLNGDKKDLLMCLAVALMKADTLASIPKLDVRGRAFISFQYLGEGSLPQSIATSLSSILLQMHHIQPIIASEIHVSNETPQSIKVPALISLSHFLIAVITKDRRSVEFSESKFKEEERPLTKVVDEVKLASSLGRRCLVLVEQGSEIGTDALKKQDSIEWMSFTAESMRKDISSMLHDWLKKDPRFSQY